MGLTARMGPVALWVYANAYLSAVLTAPAPAPAPEVPFEPVRYYLICHSLELSLKAFLSLQGATMLKLSESSLAHNLDALLVAAEDKGLLDQVMLSSKQRTEVRKAATYYAGKVFEYPAVAEAMSAYPSLPLFDQLREAAELLVKTLEQQCKEAQ